MVPGAGIEPARRLKREILSLLCLPISPPGQISNYFLKNLLVANSIVCCYVIIIASFVQVVNTYFRICLVLKQRIEL